MFRDAGSWMAHVKNWIMGNRDEPVIVLRYERMVADPMKALEPVRDLLQISSKGLSDAVAAAEKATTIDGIFFWRRNNGGYRDFLSEEQIARFYQLHGPIARAAGYPPELS